ncbi:MAG: adenine phosphoribosyltransferase [Parachlamydia sp.]|nr:adenine phosphoribosyltransferase [Parachlamydia sp.]
MQPAVKVEGSRPVQIDPLPPNSTQQATWILDYIHPIPDFPKPGVQYHWYAHLLREPQAFRRVILELAARYRNQRLEAIAGLDSRGFIFGAALAYELNLPFIMIRKEGKLPGPLEHIDYEMEYGHSSLEIEKESLKEGQRVLIIDDVIATGGTSRAACQLVDKLKCRVVEVACLIEIVRLRGRDKIPQPVFSLLAIE